MAIDRQHRPRMTTPNPNPITRRRFVKNVGAYAVAGAGGALAAGLSGCTGTSTSILTSRKNSDIRIEHVSFGYEEHVFRAPVGFAGAVVDRATLTTVRCSV